MAVNGVHQPFPQSDFDHDGGREPAITRLSGLRFNFSRLGAR